MVYPLTPLIIFAYMLGNNNMGKYDHSHDGKGDGT